LWRVWLVDVNGKRHEVEARYNPIWKNRGKCELVVNGRVVHKWRSSPLGLKEKTGDIAGKEATLKRVGIFKQNLELFVPDASVNRVH